jgi:site-specific recombinase XerD
VLFRDAASAFIRHCQSIRKLSPHTTRAYELDLAGFTQFLGKRAAVAACDKTVIHNYVRHLFDVRTLKESSVKRHFGLHDGLAESVGARMLNCTHLWKKG